MTFPKQNIRTRRSRAISEFAVIGMIGGVGSGKSALSHWLGHHFPVITIDGDRTGHLVLGQIEVKRQLVERFGEDIIDESGEIVRSRLGEKVWGDSPERIEARKALEAIVHPEIRKSIHDQIEQARTAGNCGVILDAAVMLESGWSCVCDRIVYIDVPDRVRKQRVMSNRGWTGEQWVQREKSQLSLAEKQRRSDFVVDNSESVERAGRQLAEYLQKEFDWVALTDRPSQE